MLRLRYADGWFDIAICVSRLRGRPSVLYKNRLLITPWPRGNNGQSSERREVLCSRRSWFSRWMLTFTVGNKPGPDRATTTVGEDISFSLRAGGKVSVRSKQRTRASPLRNFSTQQTKNHLRKKRFASNLPKVPVEGKSSAVSAREATLQQNAHTRTVFQSSTRPVPVR